MDYIKVNLHIDSEDFIKDILTYDLSEIGFDAFEQTSMGVVAYCTEDIFNENSLHKIIDNELFKNKLKCRIEKLEDKNWNEIWEKISFKPIEIDKKVYIRSSAQKALQKIDYEIIINPKQSFGTGGHETTELIITQMLKMDFRDKKVLDMGCGTGILSIITSKLGATNITAVDIDTWAFENTKDNFELNNVNARVFLGDIQAIGNEKFDIIIANINRNILLTQIPFYAKMLNKSGVLIISGFYESDFEVLDSQAIRNGFSLKHQSVKNGWQMLVFEKVSCTVHL
ncbi:MAG: 50S ribosomal protein L11 methyltransferase [Prevotellaceae bacterium]|jgi:ribosomal protein L11 methyltransferase|nr:50S ribosomal protein L11 methyltransferase [Prevotellaceae bacterium]